MLAVIVGLVAAVFAGVLAVWLITRGLRHRSPAVRQAQGKITARLDHTAHAPVRRAGAGQQSLQAVLSSRRQGEFIGRRTELSEYRENLARPADDERRWSLLNIHGDAGVGKTYLTKQLRQIADSSGHVTAYIDNNFYEVTSVMIAIADQFSANGVSLTEFEKAATAYQTRLSATRRR